MNFDPKSTTTGRTNAANPARNNAPKMQNLSMMTPEARAIRAALQEHQAKHAPIPHLNLVDTEARIAAFFGAPPRHPATNIGE